MEYQLTNEMMIMPGGNDPDKKPVKKKVKKASKK